MYGDQLVKTSVSVSTSALCDLAIHVAFRLVAMAKDPDMALALKGRKFHCHWQVLSTSMSLRYASPLRLSLPISLSWRIPHFTSGSKWPALIVASETTPHDFYWIYNKLGDHTFP